MKTKPDKYTPDQPKVPGARKRKDLRGPDEPNVTIACVCGCGGRLLKYDAINRPRRFLANHFRRGKTYG